MTATLSADGRQKILFQEFTPTPNIKNVEDILRESLIKLSKPLKLVQHKYVSRHSGTVENVSRRLKKFVMQKRK
ncbi:hypothetical protein Avbf_09850, partial [Armadillidium vulgare]